MTTEIVHENFDPSSPQATLYSDLCTRVNYSLEGSTELGVEKIPHDVVTGIVSLLLADLIGALVDPIEREHCMSALRTNLEIAVMHYATDLQGTETRQ